jgi:hypothetical protein
LTPHGCPDRLLQVVTASTTLRDQILNGGRYLARSALALLGQLRYQPTRFQRAVIHELLAGVEQPLPRKSLGHQIVSSAEGVERLSLHDTTVVALHHAGNAKPTSKYYDRSQLDSAYQPLTDRRVPTAIVALYSSRRTRETSPR